MKCAACGTDGDGLKTCTACKLVKYCSVTCQKNHRRKHKKDCKKRAAEIHDEALFQTPNLREDCPICFLPLPFNKQTIFQLCCGKIVCDGCMYKAASDWHNFAFPCPFCRVPKHQSDEELFERLNKKVNANDAEGNNFLGCIYNDGTKLPQDLKKAFEFWSRAAELGNITAHNNLATLHAQGRGVERDMNKAKYHWELAAMMGHENSRHNLASLEMGAYNFDRAMKHFMIAAGAGFEHSLEPIKACYLKTKL